MTKSRNLLEIIEDVEKGQEQLKSEFLRLRRAIYKLPCMKDINGSDTDPDCPALLTDTMPTPRQSLLSIPDDEPDSVLLKKGSVRVGPLGLRAPVFAIILIGILGVPAVAVALFLTRRYLGLP